MSLGLVIAGAALAAITAAVAAIERHERTRVREELEGHAAVLRGSVAEGARQPAIEVRRHGAIVRLQLGERRGRLLSASTGWLLSPGVAIEVRAPRMLDSGEDRVAIEPIVDRTWLVRGPREVLEPALDRATRDAMLRIGTSLRITSSGDGIWLECMRPVSPSVRRGHLEALVAIALRLGTFGLDPLRGLAESLEGRLVLGAPGEPPHVAVDTAGGVVVLVLRGGVAGLSSGGPRFRARIVLTRELPAYRGRVGIEGALEPPPPPGLIGARALESAADAGVFTLRVSGRVASVQWSAPVDERTITAGVELLASLGAVPSAGAFR